MAVAQENGHAEAVVKPNGRKESVQTQRKKKFLGWTIIGLVVRLGIWYALLTPFLRCPSNISDLNDTSPRVCKPYLIARSHVEPYVTPYYDTYAAPYVDQARPYVDQARPYVEIFNKQVYVPTSKLAHAGYEKYGAPAWEQAQTYGAAQWKAQVTPRVEAAQDKVHQLYLAEVDPYVQQGFMVVSPYYHKVNSAVLTAYWDHLVPFYTRSQPFIGKAYATSQDVLVTHVMPGAQYTWSSVVYFANSSLWPHITGLYSEQVEPQLVKIGQRLASYREGKRLRAVVEEMDSSFSEQPSPSATLTSVESIHTSSSVTVTSTTEVPYVAPTLSAADKAKQVREQIDSDLQRWQDKFAAAADSGIEDLEERIEEIVGALVASSANSHGLSLSTALQSVAAKQVTTIKDRINDLVQSLPEEDAPEAEEEARDRLVDDIRTSAISVRDRAHALREWSLSFDDELLRRVSAAVNSTLDVLDGIRDLGLQEIGMRWAWMDGVTYKDWARYRAVKEQLQDWRNQIYHVGMNHKSVAEAKAVAADILDRGMEVAQETAVELVRLKDVGHWKLAAREVGDNFETRNELPPPRPKPETDAEDSEVKADLGHDESPEEFLEPSTAATIHNEGEDSSTENISDFEESFESAPGTEKDNFIESMSADAVQNDESSPIKAAWGELQQLMPTHIKLLFLMMRSKMPFIALQASSAFADSTSNAKVLYEIAKSQVMGQMAQSSEPAHAQVLSSIESAYSGAVNYATNEFDAKIAAIRATPTPAGPLAQISSIASSRLSEGLSVASEKLAHIQPIPSQTSSAGLQPYVLDAQRRYYEAVGLAHDHYTAFVSTASHAVYGTPTPTAAPLGFQQLIEEAGSQYERVSSLASASLAAVVASASSMASSADDGAAQGIIDDASSRYHAAMSAASASLSLASASVSSAVYGTTPGPLQSLSSQASENWEGLISKASEQIYGTPAPYLQQLHERLPQFEAVQGVVSELIVGKEPSFTESVMSKLRVAYETPYPAAALSSASSYVSETYESASSVADAYVSSVPSVEDVLHNVNEQLNAAVEAASIGVYGTPKGPYEQATEVVADAYNTASAQISSAVYGKEPGYIDVAREHIEEIQSKASAAIYGEEPGAVESATSRLAAAVEGAQSQLAELASKASSVASEAAETASSHVEDATGNIKSAMSSAKDEL
ncbi:uncharacterized protein N7503_003289 [Penicillium pulvis]|uniref:uncharacterized protein n=1 Tax=Penicillium pulvis TaxID=1562058 RepID=UPI002548C57B|nr:uncharacterized protein N7503_003289 [Penicillium pulvis]KAJ5805687.1 hypothetical protein N7503_003289 [Penicillium pulvis]